MHPHVRDWRTSQFKYTKTVCDMYTDIKFGFENAYVMTDVDRDALAEKIIEIIGNY